MSVIDQRTIPAGPQSDNSTLVRSYLNLRMAVGVLGIALPIALVVGVWLLPGGDTLQSSISAYIDTSMGGVLVSVLAAIGVFLWFYVGYTPKAGESPRVTDTVVSNVAGAAALGVALFPTSSSNEFVSTMHTVSAVLLFAALAYFSIKIFTKGAPQPTEQKLRRNAVYRASGYTIIACMALIGINALLPADSGIRDFKPVFVLETVALWAFGVAWFVKGEGPNPFKD